MNSVIEAITAELRSKEIMRNPGLLFTRIPEEQIWVVLPRLLTLSIKEPGILRTLLRALNEAFEQLSEKTTALNIFQESVQSTSNSLIFAAALQALHQHAEALDDRQLVSIVRICLDRYREHQNTDVFIAARALGAAVTLPLARGIPRALSYPLAVLVNEFPHPVGTDTSVELAIAALKLTSRCYEFEQSHELKAIVSNLRSDENPLVAAEATFQFGAMRYTDTFFANTFDEFFTALHQAQQALEYASSLEENRTDAALLAAIAMCFLRLTNESVQPADIQPIMAEAREILRERWYAFGAGHQDSRWSVEYAFVEMLSSLEHWTEQMSRLRTVPNIGIPLRDLAHIYELIRASQPENGLLHHATNAIQQNILVPHVRGRFAQVQGLGEKLAYLRGGSPFGDKPTDEEEAFYALIEATLAETVNPKDTATAQRLNNLRAVAVQVEPSLVPVFDSLLDADHLENKKIIETLGLFVQQRFAQKAQYLIPPGGPNNMLANRLMRDLTTMLDADTQGLESILGPAATHINQTIEVLAQYALRLREASRQKEPAVQINFLFAAEVGGLGAQANERDLQQHCYQHFYALELHPMWTGKIDTETQRGAPGRADLRLLFPGGVMLILEFKAIDRTFDRVYLHNKFVAQAQEYASATHRVSFLLVLDTSPKDQKLPLPAYEECAYVDQHIVPGSSTPSAVVIFIIPANRFLPADRSASRRKPKNT